VRALKPWYLEQLKERVRKCFEAGALATGCELSMDWHEEAEYAPMKINRPMVEAYRRNGEELGKHFFEIKDLTTGSSDMGNVSQVVPSIHPNFSVGSPTLTHSPEFTAVAATEAAHEGMLQTATTLAWTGIDIALESGLIEQIRTDFGARGTQQ
jgi:metal-dependent amidase/aminoacylase/carboxypeptidase family protein